MTKEDRRNELGIIRSHLEGIMSDLVSTECMLEELRCASIAKKLDTACGRLYNVIGDLVDKEVSLK